jgi:hypothetical protein
VQTFDSLLAGFQNGLGAPSVAVFLNHAVVLGPKAALEMFASAPADEEPARSHHGYDYQGHNHFDCPCRHEISPFVV